MKLKFNILLSFLFFCLTGLLAQSYSSSIIEELTKKDYAQGEVTIKSDPRITQLIGKQGAGHTEADPSSDVVLKMQGYRIQAFSSSQGKSKDEAFSKERQIKSQFPQLSTYVTYKAPVWRLRVGDFQTREEASSIMRDLKKEFPSFGKEMYIVTDEIKVVLY